jgi:hypothetical protein
MPCPYKSFETSVGAEFGDIFSLYIALWPASQMLWQSRG